MSNYLLVNTCIMGFANRDPKMAPIGTAPTKKALTVGLDIFYPNELTKVCEGIVERYVRENPK